MRAEPLPGMKPTRGQSQEPQDCLQGHKRTCALDRSQNPDFGAAVGQPVMRQREFRASKQSERKPKECRELPHASPKLQNFLFELPCASVRHVQADHDVWCLAEPPTGRRGRDAEIRGDGDVPGALDDIPEPVVVPPLMASCGRHSDDHQRSAYVAQASKHLLPSREKLAK
jgi:hypothetical protein